MKTLTLKMKTDSPVHGEFVALMIDLQRDNFSTHPEETPLAGPLADLLTKAERRTARYTFYDLPVTRETKEVLEHLDGELSWFGSEGDWDLEEDAIEPKRVPAFDRMAERIAEALQDLRVEEVGVTRLLKAEVCQGVRGALRRALDAAGVSREDREWSGWGDGSSTTWCVVFFTTLTAKEFQEKVWEEAASIWCQVEEIDQDAWFAGEEVGG